MVREEPFREGKRVVSRRVVSEKVLGSSHPLARTGRKAKSTISSRIGGIFWGILLVIASFVILWFSEGLAEYSKVIKDLPLLSPTEAVSETGLVKVHAVPTIEKQKSAPNSREEVLYYIFTEHNLEEVEVKSYDTEIVEIDGQDVERTIETIEMEDQWVLKEEKQDWAEFSLGDIAIDPDKASLYFDYDILSDETYADTKKKTVAVPEDDEIIVVGEIKDQEIKGGTPYMISNYSDEELISSLESSENFTYWLLKILAVLAFAIGFYMVLGPILLVLDVIPVLGKLAKSLIFVVALILAVVVMSIFTVLIKFWYLIGLVVVIVVVIVIAKNKDKALKESEADNEED